MMCMSRHQNTVSYSSYVQILVMQTNSYPASFITSTEISQKNNSIIINILIIYCLLSHPHRRYRPFILESVFCFTNPLLPSEITGRYSQLACSIFCIESTEYAISLLMTQVFVHSGTYRYDPMNERKSFLLESRA